MLYREYGKTGVTVSALGMGGMRFENPDDIETSAQVILRAFERGVTYFDTAPGYCNDKSEEIHGCAFREMKKTGKPFVAATKTMASDATSVREQCERSLERLGVDAIDFYHVWCLVHPEDYSKRKTGGAIAEFKRLKDEGLARHVCVSTHLEHDNVRQMLEQGEGLFEGMLIGMSAMNYDLRFPGIREAARRGLGVVTMNTLGGGLLMDHAEHYKFIMHEGDASMLDAAIRFNLSLPEITVALVGFRNTADVDSACDAVERFRPLSPGEIEETRRSLVTNSKDLCTQCGYCKDCHAGIPVVRFMEAYNHLKMSGPQAALNQLKWHWWTNNVRKALEACTECGHCESVCTQHLPIMARFDELRRLSDEAKG